MRPIPRSLLIHTATLEAATKDAYQDTTYQTVSTLPRVRVEPTTKQVMSKDNTQTQLAAVLIADARNSAPVPDIAVGQYVTWNSKRYRVETVDLLYDGRKLHHLEVGLSG